MLSWFTKGEKSQLPEPTALQALRAKQIEQLRLLDYSVAEIQRDVEYRIIVSDLLSIFIYLPPLFPQEKPILRVSPGVIHPWINEQMIVVGCAGINSFKAHSDLGKVLKEVIEEFVRNPPRPITSAIPLPLENPPLQSSASACKQTFSTKTVTDPVAMASAQQTTFAFVNELSSSEIKELMDNDDKVLDLLQPQMQPFVDNRSQTLQVLEVFAQENIYRQTKLEDKKRLILEKHEVLNNLRHRLDELLRSQDELRKKYDMRLMQDNLKVAALQSDEAAEAFADGFLDGKMSVDDFNKSYMAVRIQYHQRRAMEDKLAHLPPGY